MGPAPAWRSRAPTTVRVHLESAVSSTSSTAPCGTGPVMAKAPWTLRHWWALLAISNWGGPSRVRSSTWWSGRRPTSAIRSARSPTSLGWRREGTKATDALGPLQPRAQDQVLSGQEPPGLGGQRRRRRWGGAPAGAGGTAATTGRVGVIQLGPQVAHQALVGAGIGHHGSLLGLAGGR